MSAGPLRQIQISLEDFYRLDPAPQIDEFIVQPGESAALLCNQRRSEEQLIIVEDRDSDLYLGLAIEPSVLHELESPALAHENLKAFCLAVEGVSHYLFIIYCARQERHVTALELELQGEVDKYVACVMLANRAPSLSPEQIRQRLYDAFQLAEGLEILEQQRYSQANALARRYSRTLEQRFIRTFRLAAMILELRLFYRMTCQRKLEFIAGR
jgi:hypothetical protein